MFAFLDINAYSYAHLAGNMSLKKLHEAMEEEATILKSENTSTTSSANF